MVEATVPGWGERSPSALPPPAWGQPGPRGPAVPVPLHRHPPSPVLTWGSAFLRPGARTVPGWEQRGRRPALPAPPALGGLGPAQVTAELASGSEQGYPVTGAGCASSVLGWTRLEMGLPVSRDALKINVGPVRVSCRGWQRRHPGAAGAPPGSLAPAQAPLELLRSGSKSHGCASGLPAAGKSLGRGMSVPGLILIKKQFQVCKLLQERGALGMPQRGGREAWLGEPLAGGGCCSPWGGNGLGSPTGGAGAAAGWGPSQPDRRRSRGVLQPGSPPIAV